MYYIILCEGKTDSVVLNHFMCKNGFSYLMPSKAKKLPFKPSAVTNKDKIDFFEKEKDVLAIWDMAGSGNLKAVIDEIQNLIKVGNEIDAISIFIDKDNDEINKKIDDCNSYFKNEISLENKKWIFYPYKTDYKEDKVTKILTLIIPELKNGALETILLDALKRSGEDEKKISEKVEELIDNIVLEEEKYLVKDRDKIKSKLGATVNILDPERTFKGIVQVFNEIEWSNYTEVEENLNLLKDYN